jgi:hypothetical protein
VCFATLHSPACVPACLPDTLIQAAKRRAIAELIFFAGTNDQRRCKQLAATWNIDVSLSP